MHDSAPLVIGLEAVDVAAPSTEEKIVSLRSAVANAWWACANIFPPAIGASVIAINVLNRLVGDRVESEVLQRLQSGLSGSITIEMNLELGDLADLGRTNPALVEDLRRAVPDTAIETAAVSACARTRSSCSCGSSPVPVRWFSPLGAHW